ncbi:CHAT domain-containing protein [Micromonospora tulbaghiae]|uniref:CHAT domain-containing protein n=1 Tax=Micromonospora tulbaghiae TaxID=479978 RepID=UPI003434D9A1
MTNLSVALRQRSPEDLDAAIVHAGRSLALTDPQDPWYGSRVNNYGAALRARYGRTAVIRDLRDAVAAQLRLLDEGFVPDEHRPMITSNAAQGLRELYEVTLDRAYLREAVARHRTAVRLARRAGDQDRLAMILQHAGIATRLWRPHRAGIHAAIALQEEALALTGPADIHRPGRVGSLAWSWHDLTRLDPNAATTAIALFDEALAATPRDSSGRPGLLLGRAGVTRRLADFDEALAGFLRYEPIGALGAACEGALQAVRDGDDARALDFCHHGLEALGVILPGQLLRRDQRSWQKHAESLTALTALLHARAGDPVAATRVVDVLRGRESRLLAAAAQLDPEDADPRVRAARKAVQAWLDRGGPATDEPLDCVPGLPPVHIATRHDRHTVYLVCEEPGGAVLVTYPDGTAGVRLLPEVTLDAVTRQRRRLRRAYDRRTGLPAAVARCGRWLNRAVARPLLDLVPTDAPLVVVPCGPFADLPLVAARRLLGRPLLLAASGHATAAVPPPPVPGSAVAVLGTTSRINFLRTAEAESLSRYAPTTIVAEREPAAALAAIKDSSVVHFSTHGVAGRADAVETALYLPGGEALRASEILRADLSAGPLIFLASCETTSPDPSLPDQTFGPPAAFLHAGATAVVAPLLSVSEDVSALMAARFYHELSGGGGPHEALARAQKWLSGSGIGDQCAFLGEVITAAESAGEPVPGLRCLVRAIKEHPERHAELTGGWAWALFTVSI